MVGCVGDVFKALADPTRRIILDELTSRAPAPPASKASLAPSAAALIWPMHPRTADKTARAPTA